MAIIVGDIHGNVEKVRAFLVYKPQEEHVALGDYLDSYLEPSKRQREALQLLLDSSAVLLWGNHDLHYLLQPPFVCTGFQHGKEQQFQTIIEANKNRFLAAYAVDGWLCTHAGLASWMVKDGESDVNRLADSINRDFDKWLANPRSSYDGMFRIGKVRGGNQESGGIFWFYNLVETGLADIKQVFGHTKDRTPVKGSNFYCLDTTDNLSECWLFDTKETELVCLPIKRECNFSLLPSGGGLW